jgi:hypothetical protein
MFSRKTSAPSPISFPDSLGALRSGAEWADDFGFADEFES